MTERSLQTTLQRMGRWIVMIGGACGLGWGLLAMGLFLTVMVWIDLMWELPPQLRIAAVIGSAVAGLVLLGLSFTRAWKMTPAGAIARHLDQVAGTGGQILAGVEFSPLGEGMLRVGSSTLSAGLAEIAVERATWLAGRLSREKVAPLQPVRRSFAAVGLFAVVIAILLLAMPRLAHTEWYRFSDPFGDHPPYSRVQFSVEPAGKQVLYGDSLDIIARTDGVAVDKVELVLSSLDEAEKGETLPMFPEPDGSWRASITNLVRPATYFVRTHGSRSHKYQLGIITVPKIEEVRFRVTPPAYTRQGIYEGELPPGGISGLPGTKVEVIARSNRPLSGGRLTFATGNQKQTHALNGVLNDERQISGTILIEKSGRLELKLIDRDQIESNDTFTVPVTLLVDERPFVRLIEPRAVSFAVPNAILPVVISAEDDYGVGRLQLYRNLNDSRPLPQEVPLPKPAPRQAYETVLLPLATYGLEVGDEIKLFARVEDNDPGYPPVGNAVSSHPGKGAESAVVVIRIISQEELDRFQTTREGLETLMAKYREAERRFESLQEEIQQLQQELDKLKEGDEKKAAELRQKLQNLLDKMAQEAESLKKLSEQKKPFKIDEDLTKELAKRADALQRLMKRTQSQMKDKMSREQLQKLVEEMKKELKGEREHLDQEMMRPLRRLEQIFPLMEAQAEFEELVKRQRDLAERLKAIKGRDQQDDPRLKAQMRDQEEEQRQLQAKLRQLLDTIEEKAQALPEGDKELEELRKSAQDFAKAARESRADEAMGEAVQGLSEFSGTRGHDGAKRAADLLEKLLAKGRGMCNQGGMCLKFQPSLAETLKQLLGRGMGNGMGNGSGQGSSSARSAMQNVGLYGQMPSRDSASGGGGKWDKQTPAGGSPRGSKPKSPDDASAGYETTQDGTASGTGDTPVPLRYRRRSSRYFQRLADELRDR